MSGADEATETVTKFSSPTKPLCEGQAYARRGFGLPDLKVGTLTQNLLGQKPAERPRKFWGPQPKEPH